MADTRTKADLVAALEDAEAKNRKLLADLEDVHQVDGRNVVERLIDVKRQLGAIEKQEIKAGRQTYNAFTVDTVYAHLGPLLAKHGIAVVPSLDAVTYVEGETSSGTKSVDARVVVDYSFIAPDESAVTMRFAGEGRDTSDKATNKAFQQALKYGLIQMFQIATGEVDPDAVLIEAAAVDDVWTRNAKNLAYLVADRDAEMGLELYHDALDAHQLSHDTALTERQSAEIREWLRALADERQDAIYEASTQ